MQCLLYAHITIIAILSQATNSLVYYVFAQANTILAIKTQQLSMRLLHEMQYPVLPFKSQQQVC